jgi:hypothetical protein
MTMAKKKRTAADAVRERNEPKPKVEKKEPDGAPG